MIPRPASILRCAIRTNFSERESLPTTLHEGTARHTYSPVLFKSPLFYLLEVVRPERLELPAFWFVANGVKMLNALFGVAYGLETPFFPQLAAPNVAPKTKLYRICTEHFMSSIRKAEFGHAVTESHSTALQQVSVHSVQLAGSGWRWSADPGPRLNLSPKFHATMTDWAPCCIETIILRTN